MRGWRKLGWAAVALVMVAVAPGCWLQSGYDARRSANNAGESTITAANVAGLAEAWHASATVEPVVSGGTAYVASGTAVQALAVATGASRWSVPDSGADSLALAGGHLWVAGGNTGCSMRALDPATGATVTSQGFGGNAFDFGSNGRSYCSTTEVLATGDTVSTSWTYFAGALAPGPCFPGFTLQSGSGVITLDKDTGAVVSQVGGVGAAGCTFSTPETVNTLSSDGTITYMPVGDRIVRYGTCGGSPCGSLAVPAGTGTGEVVVPAAGGRLVIASGGKVLVLDAATGAVQWTGTVTTTVVESPAPTVTATTVYVTGAGGVLAAFPLAGCGAATCGPAWTCPGARSSAATSCTWRAARATRCGPTPPAGAARPPASPWPRWSSTTRATCRR
jgi:PQQ-like domain